MSDDVVIRVENLSKQYRIGSTKEGYRTFRETLVDAAKAPFLRAQEAWSMAHRALSKSINSKPPSPCSPLSSTEDTIWALKDVSFEVKRGEIIGIIGRNGAGKSTLLKILSKITEPTKGRVELKGRVGSLLEVGTGFHPELTGHENVYMYGAILGMDRWEVTRKFDEIVAFAELEKFIETPVKRYSSGMYMRLAFAVAAHLEPEILLVDEVLAVGDAQFQKKCLGKIGEVSVEGRTVLFVSHNMGAISALCGLALLLEKGVKVFEGPAISTIRRYNEIGQNVSTEWYSSLPLNKDKVSLRSVTVKDTSGRQRSDFSNHDAIAIEIDVRMSEYVPDLKIGFELEGELGIKVFTTFHNDIEEILSRDDFKSGIYRFRTIIPGRLLNSSVYYIFPCGGIHRRRWIFQEEKVVQFKVDFQVDNPDFFVDKRGGVIGPMLEWTVKHLS
ncbi:MAG: ATP-binding cassette domain-containing protein [Desulfobacterales bacterium]|uniref:ATP-binding cassette domain-containing protein n=1 Tax=Candidatus Desulfatibia vada TaxID=2841696 RepID=A0A8J6NRA4_9BACT|nr:ATP-binding cassette domain-containing protein [Candidatus Desulfatibia vada]